MNSFEKISGLLKPLLDGLGQAFRHRQEKVFLVGGAVRDILLGIEPLDLDFTTSADPGTIREAVKPLSKWIFEKSPAKGYETLGIILKNSVEIEITPFRRARGVGDSASPPPTLEEDLLSRDFTINALALDISQLDAEAVIDVCGGREDLEDRRLKTPVAPMITFEDDPLRTLRAARFASLLSATPEPELVSAVIQISRDTDWMERVAPERAREEIEKILLQDKPSAGIRMLHEWGLLRHWIPELEQLSEMAPEPGTHHKDTFSHTMETLDKIAENGPDAAAFRFAALLHDIGKPKSRTLEDGAYSFIDHEKIGAELAGDVCRRLRFSNSDTERIIAIVKLHHRISGYTPAWTDAAVRRALHDLGENYSEIISLGRSDISTSDPEKAKVNIERVDHFEERVSKLEKESIMNPVPPIDGNEVMSILDIPPGPEVGRAVQFLKDLVVAGKLDPDDADTARRLIREKGWE